MTDDKNDNVVSLDDARPFSILPANPRPDQPTDKVTDLGDLIHLDVYVDAATAWIIIDAMRQTK